MYFNPLQLAWLSAQFTEWTCAHECAYHVLGDWPHMPGHYRAIALRSCLG